VAAATSPLALLGATSTAGHGTSGSDDIGISQEFEYALHDRPRGLRGKRIAGQLVTRRLRQIDDQLWRPLNLVEPVLDGGGVDDYIPV
jgi:hypothetical protein